MSAATMSGADAVKGVSASGSKPSLKSSNSGKALDTARKQAASPPVEGQNRKSQPPQQKAWTGTNPITQRASAPIPNGTDKSTSRPTSQSQPKPTETNGEKHAHDRALFLFASFTGNDATITLKNGEQFSGIFSGGSFDTASKHQYILKMVKRTRLPTQQQINGASSDIPSEDEYIGQGEDHVMAFDKEDTVDLSVSDVTPITAQPTQNGSINTSFRTDTEISGRDPSMPRARELQRWDAGDAAEDLSLSLEDSGTLGWDQFAANESKYGVSTSYDENIYTTQIDRSDPRYKQLEDRAARIAREIEGTAPANAHVAEERRQDAQGGDAGMDEEEKYSGVRREGTNLPKRAAGAYVPPSQRPLTNAPTVPGAPFDPAIISLAKPAASTDRGIEQPKAADAAIPELRTPPTEVGAKDVKGSGGASTQQTPAKKNENTTEDHVRGVADSFKQFANNEKLRMRMAQQHIQEQKRTAQRAEKNVKLNDLKKFAANFKLNSRIPDDLVPILAKDHDKQKEIQRKADDAWKDEEKRAKEREVEKASIGAASPGPSEAGSLAATPSVDKVVAPHVPFNQQTRGGRLSGTARQPQPIPGLPIQSPRSNAGGAPNRTYGGVPGFPPRPQPLPADIRIPTGPAHPAAPMDVGPLSPGAATKLNAGARAFEFRPGAHAFTPTGTTPSPQRLVPETADFFAKDKAADAKAKEAEKSDDKEAFSSVKQMQDEFAEQKTQLSGIGGVPPPFRAPPTWHLEGQKFTSFEESMPKAPTPSQPHSQVHTPNPNVGQMPQTHQHVQHMQGPHGTPTHRPPYMHPQHMPPNMTPHQQNFGPGVHGFAGNGSVHSSPRFQGAQVAFNGQIPPNMGMPPFAGQQFGGQPMGMQGYGVSPSMGYRQVHVPGMPPNAGGMMMMGPGGQGQHGQMPMGPQNYRGNPNQYNPNTMPGGVPMANQGSHSGYPMPGQGPQSYSPMPPHATPHMPHAHAHHIQHSPYAGSPRPAHMMHTASHQGFQPGVAQYGPNAAGMGQNYPHAYAMQHRQMSAGGYPAMTPRQQAAMPNLPMQPSPGMGGGAGSHGDEGK